jgi:hypothetical protein
VKQSEIQIKPISAWSKPTGGFTPNQQKNSPTSPKETSKLFPLKAQQRFEVFSINV